MPNEGRVKGLDAWESGWPQEGCAVARLLNRKRSFVQDVSSHSR